MTKQEEQYVLNSFEPFLQPFEQSGSDDRKFTCEQCMDLYKAFRLAMYSDREDIESAAMKAGKSAYHHMIHGNIELGDGVLMKNTYLAVMSEPESFKFFPLAMQQDLLYELAKGVRIKEQINDLERSGSVLKNAAAMTNAPQDDREWNTVCEALRIDEALRDPGHFLPKILAFERPENMETIKGCQDSLHAYLDANGLPHEYEALKTHTESITGKPVKELVDLRQKTQWDVPFDQICAKAHENGVHMNPRDAVRSTMREAQLIDRMEPCSIKNEMMESFFERAYNTIHYEAHIQVKEGENPRFPFGLGKELKSECKNAAFLKEYEAYEQKRDNEALTLTDDDLKGLENPEHANAL